VTHDSSSERPAPWWRDAVVYEVYPRSFADADGDGEGDLAGLTGRLDHLVGLGVDALWVTPWYPSPMADGGYDVADYRDIDPRYGSLQDADLLLARAHELGLRVVVDLVPNHTSSQHPWFLEALASPPGSAARGRYLFRDGRGPDGEQPPNDWISAFSGPAWTRVTGPDGRPGQWYLHTFAPEQPDLDWTNPDVLAEFDDIIRFWFDRGVDGIRVDAAPAMMKAPGLPDAGHAPGAAFETWLWPSSPQWDRPEVHDILRRWRVLADRYDGDRLMVSEAVVSSPERLAAYVRPDELHQSFNFQFLRCRWDAAELRAAVQETVASHDAVGASPTWVLSSHDEVRHLTRLAPGADHEQAERRARAAALLLLGLPGSAYLYQGEELGLPEVLGLPDELRQDPSFARSGGATGFRDGCRVPLPWSGDAPPFGFGPAGSTPWLPQPTDWSQLTVGAQRQDEGSVLHLYTAALRLRRELRAERARPLSWLDLGDGVVAFRLGRFGCVVNVDAPAVRLDEGLGRVRLRSDGPALHDRTLPADTAAWLLAD
jgi:alpha-glucosidase